MASLLLPVLGNEGGFNLLIIYRNCTPEIKCGITSDSYKNRKKQIIGNFFSNIFIYYQVNSNPWL